MSLGHITPREKSSKEKQYDEQWQSQYKTVIYEENIRDDTFQYLSNSRMLENQRNEAQYEVIKRIPIIIGGEKTKMTKKVALLKIPESDIRLDPPQKSSQERKPTGLKGMSPYGKRMVRNGCHILTEFYGCGRLGIVTVTVPPLDPVGQMVINEDWSNITRKFYQEIRRELERQNAPTHYVGVTEIQEKRLAKYGQVYPHLHLIYVARGEYSGYYISASKFREIWGRIVLNTLKYYGLSVDNLKFNNSVDCQKLKKDPSKYLSKYMSKGTKVIEKVQELGCPIIKQWWSINSDLKKLIWHGIKPIAGDLTSAIFSLGDKLVERGLFYYLYSITRDGIDRMGQVYSIHNGYVGKLTAKGMRIFGC